MTLPVPDSPLRVALFEPRIPPNTGNIARTCAAFRLPLALIEPLGFSIDDRSLKRAGLDYWPHVQLSTHPELEHLIGQLPAAHRLIGCSRHGANGWDHFSFRSVMFCCSAEKTQGYCLSYESDVITSSRFQCLVGWTLVEREECAVSICRWLALW